MTPTYNPGTLGFIRRELLYFSQDKNEKDDDFINAYTYYGRKKSIAKSGATYATGSGSGDFNGQQIVFSMMKYLLTIYMFSLHKKQGNPETKKRFHTELRDFNSMFHHLGITFTGSPKDEQTVRDFLASSQKEFYGQKSEVFFGHETKPQCFYNLEITSKPLMYLLFYFTGYGGNEYLLKDFKKIARQSEEMSYEKQQFIFQTSVALYREDFLLTMMLEPLSKNVTPETLVEMYNQHLTYYNELLAKDKEKGLPSRITGYSEKNSTNFRSNIAPPATLLPDNYYHSHPFPDFVLSLTDKDKLKIIEIISDLYNLAFDKKSLTDSIEQDNDSRLIAYIKQKYEAANPQKNRNIWQYSIQDKAELKALQMYWSSNKKLHLVFNERIVEILAEFNLEHPFVYINTHP